MKKMNFSHSLTRSLNGRFVAVLVFALSIFCATDGWGQTLIDSTGDGGFETGATFAENGWLQSTQPTTFFGEVGDTATVYARSRSDYIANPPGAN